MDLLLVGKSTTLWWLVLLDERGRKRVREWRKGRKWKEVGNKKKKRTSEEIGSGGKAE